MDFKQELTKYLKKQINEQFNLEIPPNPSFGDYSLPCFKLSKKPEELKNTLKLPKFIEKVDIKGPYINFFINKKILMQQTLTKIFKEKDKYGSNFLGKNKKALIEHTSINPNASPHIGRARNAIIGDSIVKLLKFEGYNTEVHYYVNDIGKQIAMLVLACKGKTPSFKQLLDLYIEFNRKMELDKSIEKEVLDLLNKLESGDKYVFKSFRKVVNICIKGQKRIFGELNIKYDYFDYESDFFFNKDASKILDILESKGKLFVDEEKRRAINLDGFNLPMEHHYLPLTRSDNTSLYMLRDLAYTIYKN